MSNPPEVTLPTLEDVLKAGVPAGSRRLIDCKPTILKATNQIRIVCVGVLWRLNTNNPEPQVVIEVSDPKEMDVFGVQHWASLAKAATKPGYPNPVDLLNQLANWAVETPFVNFQVDSHRTFA